jgi:hypothetical protein
VCRILERNEHVINTVFHPWLNHEDMAAAVVAKGSPLTNIWGFVDGTLIKICRPSEDQEEMYNGHKRFHGVKYQTVMCPNGMIAHIFGPYPGRRHDSSMYRESDLEDELVQVFDRNGRQMKIYGDLGYPLRDVLVVPFKGNNLCNLQKEFNLLMSKERITVEWGFAKITSIFAYLDFSKNQKIFLQPVGHYFRLAAILANCHTCLYGSQVALYFNLTPPTLNEYLY